MSSLLILATCLALVGMVVFLLGPRTPTTARTPPAPSLPNDLKALEAWIAEREAALPDIRPGLDKRILWADPNAQEKTPLAIVYLHGFSASPREVSPLIDNLSRRLEANAFLMRLHGHARDPDAMKETSLEGYLADAVEALAIGRKLGERVLLIGNSHGGTLATWLAGQMNPEELAGLILLTPNFFPADKRVHIAYLPWGEQIAQLAGGKYRLNTRQNALHEERWSLRYPTIAVLPMMGLCKTVERMDLSAIDAPVQMFVVTEDRVIDTEIAKQRFAEFPHPGNQLIEYPAVPDMDQHLVAGEALAADITDTTEGAIYVFLHSQGLTPMEPSTPLDP